MQVIAIILAVGIVMTVGVVVALFAMRKFSQVPSTKPGNTAGFKPLMASSAHMTSKPKESISDMLAGSETLEFEADVESSGSRWGWKTEGHSTFSVQQQPSRPTPNRGR